MQKTSTLLTWLFKAPLKFALISFITSILAISIYAMITSTQPPIFILLTISFALAVYFTVRKLPKIKMDKQSFVAIYTAQMLLTFLLLTVSTYILVSNQQTIMFRLMMLNTNHTTSFLFIIILLALYFLFLLGTAITNLYIKICCIQQFNIPTWKMIISFPFGFGMLWIPGYLLNNNTTKKPAQEIKSKTYSRIINWTLKNNINTISMFVFITLLSGFFVGILPTLLTFIMALIFGLWSNQIGAKKFEKQINKTYSTTAVVINILMIIIISCFYAFAPKQTVEINISESEIITTQEQ
jgi:hypothetical protein